MKQQETCSSHAPSPTLVITIELDTHRGENLNCGVALADLAIPSKTMQEGKCMDNTKPLSPPLEQSRELKGNVGAQVASLANEDLDSNVDQNDELDVIEDRCISQSMVKHLGLGKVGTSRNP